MANANIIIEVPAWRMKLLGWSSVVIQFLPQKWARAVVLAIIPELARMPERD